MYVGGKSNLPLNAEEPSKRAARTNLGLVGARRTLAVMALALLGSACTTQFNNPESTGGESIVQPGPGILSLAVVTNPPGAPDQLVGAVGAVPANASIEVYKEPGLVTLLGTATAAADGSF